MSTETVPTPGFDVEALLAPIMPDSPAGPNLRDVMNSVHAKLQEKIERLNNPTEKGVTKGFWTTDVVEPGLRAFKDESKDLEIAAWVARGLLQSKGLLGLYVGLRLVEGLHTIYWQTMHTVPSSWEPLGRDALEARRSVLQDLDEVVAAELRLYQFLSSGQANDALNVATWSTAQQAVAKGNTELQDKHLKVAAGLRRAQLQAPLDYLQHTSALLSRLSKKLQELYKPLGKERPSLSQLEAAVEATISYLTELLKVAQPDPEIVTPVPTASAPAVRLAEPAAAALDAGPAAHKYFPHDRADALTMLKDAAVFLHQLEPLSPIAYLVIRAVRWGQMTTLNEWMEELRVEGDGDGLRAQFGPSAFEQHRRVTKYVPANRQDAFTLLADVSIYLQKTEPLSPIPVLIQKAIRWGSKLSYAACIAEVLSDSQSLLGQVRKLLSIDEKHEPISPPK